MGRTRRQISPRLKFQVVLETLRGEKTIGQIAKAYDVHPVAVGLWKKQFLERGAELFDAGGRKDHAERRIAELEQLLGKKEVELAPLKNFLRPVP